jgi:excisionase family DNA binding protein
MTQVIANIVVQLSADLPIYQCPEDAAKTLGIGRNTIEELMDDKRDPLPHIKIGNRRKVSIPRAIEWLDRR